MIAIAALAKPLRRKVMQVIGFEDRWSSETDWEPDDAKAYTAALLETVESILKTDTTENWRKKLAAEGVPCGPLRLREQLVDDEQVVANNFVVRLEHETLGGLTVVAPPVVYSETPLRVGKASPQLGEHTHEVLTEAGLSGTEIQDLARRGVIRLL